MQIERNAFLRIRKSLSVNLGKVRINIKLPILVFVPILITNRLFELELIVNSEYIRFL